MTGHLTQRSPLPTSDVWSMVRDDGLSGKSDSCVECVTTYVPAEVASPP